MNAVCRPLCVGVYISFHVVMVNGKYLLFMGIVISIKRVERKGDRTDEGITKRKIRKE